MTDEIRTVIAEFLGPEIHWSTERDEVADRFLSALHAAGYEIVPKESGE